VNIPSSARTLQGCLVCVLIAVIACQPDLTVDETPTTPDSLPGLTAMGNASSGSETEATADQEQQPTVAADLGQSRSTAIVLAANAVAPAVVSISVIRTQQVPTRSMFQTFLVPRRSAGFGSGVIVRSDGIVLTNDHVIAGAEQIRVTLPGGGDYTAELIGTDPLADIAVLRIRGENLPVAAVGTAQGLLIGEWALAIGNPLGNYAADTKPTVTAGVISALNRNIVPSSEGGGFYFGMIQTDASINPGNSGGPLVNAAGEVIGINASIISRGGGSEGLGFAIPIDRALRIADDLVRLGEVQRAWVGLDVEPVDADIFGRTHGVRIGRVAPESPGARAALRPGDRLLSANGRSLTGPLDFEGLLLDLRAGDRLSIEVEGRSGPAVLEAVQFPSSTAERITVLRDIELITVTPQVRAERGIVSEQGALITGISEELSARLSLVPGDVIIGLDRKLVSSAEELAALFDSLTGTGRVALHFERNGRYNMRQFNWRR